MERMLRLRELLELSPGDSFLQHAVALELVKAGDVDGGIAAFQSLLDRDPDYLGSYYQLGKLFETKGNEAQAISCYEKGMAVARQQKDMHALGELRTAYDELAG